MPLPTRPPLLLHLCLINSLVLLHNHSLPPHHQKRCAYHYINPPYNKVIFKKMKAWIMRFIRHGIHTRHWCKYCSIIARKMYCKGQSSTQFTHTFYTWGECTLQATLDCRTPCCIFSSAACKMFRRILYLWGS